MGTKPSKETYIAPPAQRQSIHAQNELDRLSHDEEVTVGIGEVLFGLGAVWRGVKHISHHRYLRDEAVHANSHINGDRYNRILQEMHTMQKIGLPVSPVVARSIEKRAAKVRHNRRDSVPYASPVSEDGYTEEVHVVGRDVVLFRYKDPRIAEVIHKGNMLGVLVKSVQDGDDNPRLINPLEGTHATKNYYFLKPEALERMPVKVRIVQVEDVRANADGLLAFARLSIDTNKGRSDVRLYENPQEMVRDVLLGAAESMKADIPQDIELIYNGRQLRVFGATRDRLRDAAYGNGARILGRLIDDDNFPNTYSDKGFLAISLANAPLELEGRYAVLAQNTEQTVGVYGYKIQADTIARSIVLELRSLEAERYGEKATKKGEMPKTIVVEIEGKYLVIQNWRDLFNNGVFPSSLIQLINDHEHVALDGTSNDCFAYGENK